jgi:hypothetical protein
LKALSNFGLIGVQLPEKIHEELRRFERRPFVGKLEAKLSVLYNTDSKNQWVREDFKEVEFLPCTFSIYGIFVLTFGTKAILESAKIYPR